MKNYHDIVLAFAGVFQSAALVNQLATKGKIEDQDAFQTTIRSLLQTQPENALDVFGGQLYHLELGLETLIEQFSTLDDQNIVSCWGGLLYLEKRLSKNLEAKSQLAQRIQRLPEQLTYHGLLSERMLSIMASTYVDIISPLGKKIHINGEANYLQQPFIQDKVRACLLAGLRSVILWRQMGGNKWQLFFSRGKVIKTAEEIYLTIYS
ncbi:MULTISPECIES: high frequency lysogenization protein HflD [Pasteurellaceae]|uniref:High frequency lysogenization protein HflD homolog n=1 Tax=Rodentibacter genomosp. 1 TaxID=1908264 RepID=A0A1V3J7I8_9PAST|nr:high frequency lysogenization protein HflD [Rodentibacter genomosp. 1]MBF0750863.1 high frequency lysogenization protein HflD [Pasteurella sp. 19428wF3_WM03]OOF51265.1 lysogenization regulator HflD [Rodentibacter genomosp. 1]TFU53128.1 high frequency lysogenization protein HflD [Pasteurella sp. WM03]